MIKTGEMVSVDRKTKSGREVTARKSVPDKSKPLPPPRCDHCGNPIEVGTPYKWIAPRSGPYGGTKRYRHESCPTWNVWEYSNSLSALIAAAQHDAQEALTSAKIKVILKQSRVTSQLRSKILLIRRTSQLTTSSPASVTRPMSRKNSATLPDNLEGWVSDIESFQEAGLPRARG